MRSNPKDQIIISDFQLKSGKKAVLEVVVHSQVTTEIKVIIQDYLGRPRLTQSLKLVRGEQVLQFPTDNFTSGRFNAWITHHDKTYIRSFNLKIPKKRPSFRAFFNKVAGF